MNLSTETEQKIPHVHQPLEPYQNSVKQSSPQNQCQPVPQDKPQTNIEPVPILMVQLENATYHYLGGLDQLLVKQQIEMFEVITGHETQNRYVVTNSVGQQLLYALEESDFCERQHCGSNREFRMNVTDNFGSAVFTIDRPRKCSGCWADCCLQEMTICKYSGEHMGTVRQLKSACGAARFAIEDESGRTILWIMGPAWFCGVEVEYPVVSLDLSTQVGKISKLYAGFAQEIFTKANNFSLSFPMDLATSMKATLLAAAFLIVMFYFILFRPSQ